MHPFCEVYGIYSDYVPLGTEAVRGCSSVAWSDYRTSNLRQSARCFRQVESMSRTGNWTVPTLVEAQEPFLRVGHVLRSVSRDCRALDAWLQQQRKQ